MDGIVPLMIIGDQMKQGAETSYNLHLIIVTLFQAEQAGEPQYRTFTRYRLVGILYMHLVKAY